MYKILCSLLLSFSFSFASLVGSNYNQRDLLVLEELNIDTAYITDYKLQKTYNAVVTAIRPLPKETVNTIITFETLSSTEWRPPQEKMLFEPNLFIEINELNLNSKINAMESYDFEKRDYPHPRSPDSIKINAQNHGKNIGVIFAEAFCVLRNVIKING